MSFNKDPQQIGYWMLFVSGVLLVVAGLVCGAYWIIGKVWTAIVPIIR